MQRTERGVEMPWFPEFASAVELARLETQTEGRADPVKQYFRALNESDTHALERVWPGEVVIHDPRAGEVRGHKELRRFVRKNQSWLGESYANTETVASTVVGDRAVVELLAHIGTDDGRELAWPVAVVAESPDERSVVFRTYCRRWPLDEPRQIRPPMLRPSDIPLSDVVGVHHAALDEGDTEGVVSTFAPDGYFNEPLGPLTAHRGTFELRSFFAKCFSVGGGIGLQHCAVTDDGVRCALEYNCVRWGRHDLPPQAGIGIYERGPDGLLAAARVYDDVEAPFNHP